jgi:hypothetical protein
MCNLFSSNKPDLSSFKIENYSLDKINKNDWQPIRLWRNAQLNILRQNEPISPKEQELYWEKQTLSTISESRTFCFSYKEKDRCIGYGGLVHIDQEKKSAEVSTLLDPIFSEPSLHFIKTTAIFIELTKQLALAIGIKHLRAEIFDHRIEIIRLFYDIGFKATGYTPHSKKWDNISYGSWHMSLDI